MTAVDLIVIAAVILLALAGASRGMVLTTLTAAGFVAGAIGGAVLADYLVPGDSSPYAPLVALTAALAGGAVLHAIGTSLGLSVRRELQRVALLGAVDKLGGLVVGGVIGLALAWVVGALLLHGPTSDDVRRAVQRSEVLSRLNEAVPPITIIDALERIDPLPLVTFPSPPLEPADPRVLDVPGVRRAAPSVVRVVGTACGIGMGGSGWVGARGLVVTNAHVVAGQDTTRVQAPGGDSLDAVPVAYDERSDVAVLRVEGLDARPLRLVGPTSGHSVAIMGYPGGGRLTVTAGRIGRTATVNVSVEGDFVRRPVTVFGGEVRRGNSGGPAVNANGAVETTVFAGRTGGGGGLGVPAASVREALDRARAGTEISTGPCRVS